MASLGDFVRLARPQQWYKNLVIFIAIFFKGELLDPTKLTSVALGFVALCLISSTNYIINDLIDKHKDRTNAEKKHRPIASGAIGSIQAIIFAVILATLAITTAVQLGTLFMGTIISLFFLTSLYSLCLKNEVFVDIILIAINFVLRAVAGTFIIDVDISPWLIIGTFFLSIFLSLSKRIAESRLLKGNMAAHRKTLPYYATEMAQQLLISAATILIVCFSLYSFLSEHKKVIWTLPLFVYLIYRYLFIVEYKPTIARNPEKIVTDTYFMGVLLLMIGATILFIYV